ncbi:MAG TPA: carboxypeptidase-like regulatory domain-containing protein [Acidobacteriaceae bacterium]|nr:carboxypeptidase-like regulatory domain-containing protein [Acidobacteriaceae bacterium]
MKAGRPKTKAPILSLWLAWITVALCTSLLPLALHGQIGASGIAGTVTDPTGAAVPNAKITITNESTGVQRQTVSSSSGDYFVRGLPPGTYTVGTEVPGFQTTTAAHVVTEVDEVSTVNVTLKVGATTTQVSVAAATAATLNTESATVGTLVTAKELTNLPLDGRSWISLNYLTPGAVNFHGTTAHESIMGSVTPPNVVLNGLRGGNNGYYIDGSSLQDRETQVIRVIPPIDSLSEFRVQTSNFDAQYANGAGGAITAATKSGTNRLHGSVWEYIRNDDLDARSYFNTTRPPLHRNQFGGVAGGPIIRNKAFFFGGYEGFRQSQGQQLVADYPTAAERSGDLSSIPNPVINPYTGVPYVHNQVPVNPLSTQWFNDFIPLPNTNVPVGQGNFRIAAPAPINYNSYVARGDYTFSEQTSLVLRYLGTWANGETPWYISEFLRPVRNIGQNAAMEAIHTFTPSFVGQLNFSWNHGFADETTANTGNKNMLTELGLVPGAYGFTTSAYSAQAPPGVSVTGFGSFGNSLFGRPRQFYGDSYDGDLLFYFNRGSHNIKFGGKLWREFYNFPEAIRPTGSWSYNGFFTGNALADYLLQLPRSISSLPQPFYQDVWRWQDGLWFQDDWKVNSNLTVNVGLRFDFDQRFLSHSGRLANVDLSTPPIATLVYPKANAPGCPPGGCQPANPPGWNPFLVDPHKLLWSPRLGAAYRVGVGSVVRAGFGMYWQPLTTDPIVNMSLNPPFVTSVGATYDLTTLATFNRSNPLLNSPAAGIAVEATQQHIRDGLVYQWNLAVEHAFGANVLTVGYLGNSGVDLYSFSSPNLAPPGPGLINPRRPYTNFGGISYQYGETNSNYNALQAKMTRRFTNGLAYTVGYAWGKCLDNSDGTYIESESDEYQQPNNRAAEYSNCEFDVRNALTFSYIYALPFGHGQRLLNNASGVANAIVGGWQLEGITSMFSGSHEAFVTNSWDNLNNGGIGYPDKVCSPNLGRGRSNRQKVAMFFNTACFAAPHGGTIGVANYFYGDSVRHPLDSPGEILWNMGLQKNTQVFEALNVRFTAESFNLFNRANFQPPSTSFGTPQFGTLTAANAGREIQFGLDLIF